MRIVFFKILNSHRFLFIELSLKKQHNVSLTGNLVSSSATETPNSSQDINLPLFRYLGWNDTVTAIESDFDSVDAIPDILDTSFDESIDHSAASSDNYVPRPIIMPRRTSGVNRVSTNSRLGINSAGHSSFPSNSSYSAFTRPGLSQKNVSPVPSIVASECSDSTLTASMTSLANNSFSDHGDFRFDSHYGGIGGYTETNPFQQLPSARITKPCLDKYYFTPLHGDKNETNSRNFNESPVKAHQYPAYQMQQQQFFPQCMGPAQKSMIGIENSSRQVQYNFAPHHQHQVLPPALCSYPTRNSNCSTSLNSPLYCGPTIDPSTREALPETQGSDTYLAAIMKNTTLESPTRLRKHSVDSIDLNISPVTNDSTDNTAGSLSPLPQNLKGDLHRLAKVKTELCLHYARGKECPFGSRCNYAHGEDELKYTKLFELKDAGLIDDVTTYRTHPCASWVATGAW